MSDIIVEILHHDEDGVIFQTTSGSSTAWHTVGYDHHDGWCCTCEQYHFRKGYCRHMRACATYAKSQGILINDDHVYDDDPVVGVVV